MELCTSLKWLSAGFALGAAVLWLLSARVKFPSLFPIVVTSVHSMDNQIIGQQVVSSGSSAEIDELGRNMIKQGRLSGWAAAAACVSATLQAAGIVLACP